VARSCIGRARRRLRQVRRSANGRPEKHRQRLGSSGRTSVRSGCAQRGMTTPTLPSAAVFIDSEPTEPMIRAQTHVQPSVRVTHLTCRARGWDGRCRAVRQMQWATDWLTRIFDSCGLARALRSGPSANVAPVTRVPYGHGGSARPSEQRGEVQSSGADIWVVGGPGDQRRLGYSTSSGLRDPTSHGAMKIEP
jgi:hypothetical protein